MGAGRRLSRDLLARSDVDAVLIAAPDHWHGQMALDALAAGKDVYLEKPMTHSLEEARAIVDAVQKYNRILQVGNQGLSLPSTRRSKELIDAGSGGFEHASILLDLDGDKRDELYVASDNQKEVRLRFEGFTDVVLKNSAPAARKLV